MPLPSKILDIVFPTGDAHALCGIAVGDTFSTLILPGFWNDSHSDGKVRHGFLDLGSDGISQLSCSVTDTLGRVSRVDVTLEIETEEAEQRVFAELRELLQKRTGLAGAKERKTIEWPVVGAFESRIGERLASFTMNGSRYHRVELYLCLAPGFEITADASSLFIDVRALSEVLATEAWPAKKVEDVLARYFSKDHVWNVDAEDRRDYQAILDAAKEERPEALPAMMDRICAITPWTDADKGSSAEQCIYPLREIGSYSHNLSSNRSPSTGRWLRTNPFDIACMVRLIGAPPAERGAWAAKVVRALEWGEPDAMEAVRERTRNAKIEAWNHLVWDAPDDIEGRAFDLLTSSLPTDEERALWPLAASSFASSAANGCLSYFAGRGLPRPSVQVPSGATDSLRTWTEYGMFLKEHFPARFDDAFAKLFDKTKIDGAVARAICDQLADRKDMADGKTVWTVGQHDVSHSGDPAGGRWSIRRAKPAKAAKAKPAAKAK